MTTQHQQNAHPVSTMTAEEALSAWWDGECADQHVPCVDRFLAMATGDARQSLRSYSLIGAALRHEPLDMRDISLLVSARLAQDAARADEVVHAAQSPAPAVLPFPQSRVRRSINAWRGGIAASFVAALVGIGVWMMPQQGTELPSAPVGTGNALQASVSPGTMPKSPGLEPVAMQVAPGSVLPAWAQASSARKAPMNPYLMTHFESASPDLSEVMPTLRMINFHPE
ncbi:hypothetical protein A9404_05365 [Halothiobacillus diazotrophicus]|uniref:Anti sigma-E protein RseA N-terminal domain-containing protein n=1 Tax=Halothiobacillus diazotrophicus TaxID=1860122 RepID=A0A191ZG99_9GAMM|nr:sigma-E factor negative regulatory protein [Halothiobacillus diazotrophicus]ANJ66880.1 hypothetical protein A9404_05365 [Halothiobacillus diazotrophicus]